VAPAARAFRILVVIHCKDDGILIVALHANRVQLSTSQLVHDANMDEPYLQLGKYVCSITGAWTNRGVSYANTCAPNSPTSDNLGC
jgi:hypothetical protein